ncbi:response regulator [Pseudoduganella sp. LjRoot289]|uniref:hybrid sensor histidine kinase/response regulator n=1 Tax=Pseudoduganella sp. LjRoot289 TaxID=3342314 RepID=UPI003ECE29CD
MKALFYPAIKLMGRLRYAHKFLLLGLLALVAVVVLQVSLYHAMDQVVEPSRDELRGLEALVRLNRAVQLVQHDRGLSAGLLGGITSLAGRQQAKAVEVDNAFLRLGEALPPEVAATARWREISADWRALRQFGLEWTQQTNTLRHEQLIAKMLVLASDVADASALTLDPGIGSFYMMDNLVKLPFFTERLGQTRATGAAILARKTVTDAEKLQMAGLLGHTRIARDLQAANLAKVLHYNPELRATLGSQDQGVEAGMRVALAMVEDDIIGAAFGTSSEAYIEQFTNLIDQIYAAGNDVLAPALRGQIERRIAAARSRLAWTLVLSVLACALFAYLALGAYLALTGQIQHVLSTLRTLSDDSAGRAQLVEAIASGDLSREVPDPPPLDLGTLEVRRDEIGALVGAIAAMSAAQQSLGRCFARMARTLRLHRDEERLQDWAKSGINALNIELRGDRELDALTQAVVSFLTRHVGGAVGALYLHDAGRRWLDLAASHAYMPGTAPRAGFALGEGWAGCAARAGRIELLAPVPGGYLDVASALGQAAPAAVVAVPLLHNGELMGLVEIGSFGAFDAERLDWLRQAAEAVAVAIGVERARRRVAILLEQTQVQTEELMVQQEELQQSNEELEERARLLEQQRELIRQKSAESEQASRALRRKADELERTSAYKSEFLANMSHELRTPLNSMLILSSLLQQNKEGKLSGKQVEYAATINSAGKDLLNLINDILDLSKIEAGRVELALGDVVLADMAEQLRGLFQPLAEHQGLAFSVDLGPGVPRALRTDDQRLQQILKNLLANALKFTTHGRVALSVRAAASGEHGLQGAALAFAVSDTGLGVAPDQQERIFHAFQQADGSTSRKFGGTGLGLSISRQLARRMGGEISLSSAPGAGSIFTLFLPLDASLVLAAPGPAPDQVSAHGAAAAYAASRASIGYAPGGAAPTFAPGGAAHAYAPGLAGHAAGPAMPAAPPPSARAGHRRVEVIPAGDAPAAASAAASPSAQGGSIPAMAIADDRELAQAERRCILIVEDDLSFAGILRDTVREHGFLAIVACDGEDGLALAERYRPNAILLDVMLPHIDGWGVMRSIKDNPATRHIPVHFITCLEDRQKAMGLGAIGFITKPVSAVQLDAVLDSIGAAIARTDKRLLVVEDDEVQAMSVAELLQTDGLNITIARSGGAALALLAQGHYDCMVLDLGLADMSGFDLLDQLQASACAPQMPVIVHSGRSLSEVDEAALRRYTDSIIVKGAKSPERLVGEVSLFLHLVESSLPQSQQKMIRRALDREAMFEQRKVLLVDDDIRNIFSLSSVLGEKGMRIVEAGNGAEALAQLQAHPDIDIVLMDIMMPGMDGLEAVRRIRREPRWARLPVIALTAKAMLGDQKQCLDAGASDYLAKPVDLDKLFSLMRVWLYQAGEGG